MGGKLFQFNPSLQNVSQLALILKINAIIHVAIHFALSDDELHKYLYFILRHSFTQ